MALEFEPLLSPFVTIANSLITALPGLLAAIVIIAVGYLIAWLVGKAVQEVLVRTTIDKWAGKISKSMGKASLSKTLGLIVKWWIFVVFFASAVDLLQLGVLSEMLVRLASWLPHAIVAVLITVFGWVGIEYAVGLIKNEKLRSSKIVAEIVQIVLIVFLALIVLREVGINVNLAENTWLIVIGGLVVGIAIALGIGFGYAVKDAAKDLVKNILK